MTTNDLRCKRSADVNAVPVSSRETQWKPKQPLGRRNRPFCSHSSTPPLTIPEDPRRAQAPNSRVADSQLGAATPRSTRKPKLTAREHKEHKEGRGFLNVKGQRNVFRAASAGLPGRWFTSAPRSDLSK